MDQEQVDCYGMDQEQVDCYDMDQEQVDCYGMDQEQVDCYGMDHEQVDCYGMDQEQVDCYGKGSLPFYVIFSLSISPTTFTGLDYVINRECPVFCVLCWEWGWVCASCIVCRMLHVPGLFIIVCTFGFLSRLFQQQCSYIIGEHMNTCTLRRRLTCC